MSLATFILVLAALTVLSMGLIATLQRFRHRPFISGFFFAIRRGPESLRASDALPASEAGSESETGKKL